MDAQTLQKLQENAELDLACRSLVRLACEAIEAGQHGQTGVLLELQSGIIVLRREIRSFTHLPKFEN